ncbi:MAG: glycosyltransferase family 4 protein [Nitrospirota bacterium]
MHIYMVSGLAEIEIAGNQSMKNTIKHLSEFGHKISVFSFLPQNYATLQNPKKIFNSGVEFHRLPAGLSYILYAGKNIKDTIGRWGRNGEGRSAQREEYNFLGRVFYIILLFLFYLPFEFARVSYYFYKKKPDIFYGLNYQGALVASLLARIYRKPVVTRFYGASDIKERELLTLKNRFLCLDIICGMKSYSNAVIMTNDGTRGDKKLKLMGIDESKIHFWMNGLDIDDLVLPAGWEPDKFKEGRGLKGKKIIIMISRLSKWKKVDRGINCVHKLIKAFKMNDVALIIIGEGPEMESLKKLTERLGIKNEVRFIGGVPHREVYKYFTISNIFMTLYDISNLGNQLLEAMYFGLPIVTLDDGSTEDLLKNNYNSLLVKTDDIESELPLNVKKLLDNELWSREIGRNAKKTFEEKVISWKERMRLEDALIRKVADSQ